jgi:hypothetical protein
MRHRQLRRRLAPPLGGYFTERDGEVKDIAMGAVAGFPQSRHDHVATSCSWPSG